MVVRRIAGDMQQQLRTAFRERWLDMLILGLYCLALIAIYTQERSSNVARIRDNAALIAGQARARMEDRNLLVSFVCESMRIRIESDDPTARDFLTRFTTILERVDETCFPPLPPIGGG